MKTWFMAVMAAIAVVTAPVYSSDAVAAEAKLSSQSVVQAGFDNLSAEQQAQIVQSIAAAQTKDRAVVDTVDKWVNVGERIGKMVGGAAREVGVAANEFVQTDVGRMTAALIIWNYMGNDLVHIFVHVGGGMMFIVLGLSSVVFVLRRAQPLHVEYDNTSKTWYGASRIVSKHRSELSGEAVAVVMIACGVVLGVGSVIMLNV